MEQAAAHSGPEKKSFKINPSPADAFRIASAYKPAFTTDPASRFKDQQEQVRVLNSTGTLETIALGREAFDAIHNENAGDWKKTVETPEAVALVKQDTAIQTEVLRHPTLEFFARHDILIPDDADVTTVELGQENNAQEPEATINKEEWDAFVKDGKLSPERISSIADKIKSGSPLSQQELSMHGSHTKEIEALLEKSHSMESATTTSNVLRPKTFDWRQHYGPVTYGSATYKGFETPKASPPLDVDLNKLEHDSLARGVTVNNFTEEEQAQKKAEWMRDHPFASKQRPDIDLNKLEDEAMLAKAPLDIDLNKIEDDAKRQKAIDKFILEAKSGNVEKIEDILDSRKKGALERLKGMGLKALDGYMNLKPGYKLAIGVGLAGAAVLTGGMAAGVIAGAQKALSSFSMARGFYERGIAKKEREGQDYNKKVVAAKAIFWGVAASLATGLVLENLTNIIGGLSSYIDMLKTSPMEVPGDISGVATIPEIDDTPPQIMDYGAVNGLDLPADYVSPDSLPDYTVEAGDNLTKILKERVIAHIPEAGTFTDFQKENMIQNMLKYAASHPNDMDFATINQFANPNLIHPGDVIDLNKVKDVFSHANFARFAGDTLIDHASKLSPHS